MRDLVGTVVVVFDAMLAILLVGSWAGSVFGPVPSQGMALAGAWIGLATALVLLAGLAMQVRRGRSWPLQLGGILLLVLGVLVRAA